MFEDEEDARVNTSLEMPVVEGAELLLGSSVRRSLCVLGVCSEMGECGWISWLGTDGKKRKLEP